MSDKIVIQAHPRDGGILLELRTADTSAMHIPLTWGEPFTLHLAYEGGDEVEVSHLTMGTPGSRGVT